MTQRAQVQRRDRFFSPILKLLLAAGVPMGPNGLVTIRGRKSGLARTTPLAIIEVGGRRWVWAPWGEVQWVRNLRAAGRATIAVRGRKQDVSATELDPTQRVGFVRDILGPHARGITHSGSGSFVSSMVSISTIRWRRPRADVSSNCTQLEDDRRRRGTSGGRRPGRPGPAAGHSTHTGRPLGPG